MAQRASTKKRRMNNQKASSLTKKANAGKKLPKAALKAVLLKAQRASTRE